MMMSEVRLSAEERLEQEIIDFCEMYTVEGDGLSARNSVEDGLIHILALRGDDELLDLAIKKGENLNDRGEWGATPLLYAIEQRNWDTVRLLIKHGADLSLRDMHGQSPAWNAKKNEAPEVILKLLGAADAPHLHSNTEDSK